ncbi:YkgJ family cysteine cluster protein [Reichenbachiella agarivorans]|uniref:YkgJ family cysteine cluster protein n=1 Tax=Reichenbachiella agarivorans TaxID=2979464 RepID=A0ABY6CJB1_9BACT|nr:YkgJ family cysteine cluster protein [Reichenbachiella agarivorans]UXP30609.1 YkgJ family cysteine cluster protein [Reichenbachiella agarivorans]
MSIVRKVKSIERLFGRLEQEIIQFNSSANLHCKPGCGKCCAKADIDASPLEFLPWSFHLFLNGQAEQVLDQLTNDAPALCYIYQPLTLLDSHSGSCSDYAHRGLICRLFGYGASRDKFGQLRLATCKIIKESQAENYQKVSEAIAQGQYVPIFSDYYQQLAQIDIRLGNTMVPINQALKMALEEVLQHYAYRPFPRGLKGAA